MEVIELLCMMQKYQRVCIYPADDLEWNSDNPYTLEALQVRELTWCFVEAVGNRTVVHIGSDSKEDSGEYNSTFIKIEYR